MNVSVSKSQIVWALERLALTEQQRAGDQKQRTVLIRQLGQQHLRDQFLFDIGVDFVRMMVGMAAKIFEMHQLGRFLPVETHMVMNMPHTGQHQHKQRGVEQMVMSGRMHDF